MATPVSTASGFPQPPKPAFPTQGDQLPGADPLNARPHLGQYGPVLPYVTADNFLALPNAGGSGANQTLLSTLTQLNNRGYQNVAESQALSPVVDQMRRARQSMAVAGYGRGLANSGIVNAGRQGIQQQYQQGVLGANAKGQEAENARQQNLLKSLLASGASERQALSDTTRAALTAAGVELGQDNMNEQRTLDYVHGGVNIAALLAGGAYGAAAGSGGAAAGTGAATASGAMAGATVANQLYGSGATPSYDFNSQQNQQPNNRPVGSDPNDPYGFRSKYSGMQTIGGGRLNEANQYLSKYY